MNGTALPALTFVIASSIAAANYASAEPVRLLDQFSEPHAGQAFVCCGREWAQTFTAGITGYLDSIQVYLGLEFGGFSAVGPLGVEVRRTVAGQPSIKFRDVLSSGTMQRQSFAQTGFYEFDVASAGIAVRTGDQLAIVLTNADPDSVAPWTWRYSGAEQSSYDRGAMFLRFDTVSAWSPGLFENEDFTFRTFVSPAELAPVPEPASGLLAGSALLLLYRHYRKRPAALPHPTRLSKP